MNGIVLNYAEIRNVYEWMNEWMNVVFIARVSRLTRDIDIAIFVCPAVRDTLMVLYENGLTYITYRHSFSPYGNPIFLVLPASNIFTKFQLGHPLRGR